jgi:hypothetical protein
MHVAAQKHSGMPRMIFELSGAEKAAFRLKFLSIGRSLYHRSFDTLLRCPTNLETFIPMREHFLTSNDQLLFIREEGMIHTRVRRSSVRILMPETSAQAGTKSVGSLASTDRWTRFLGIESRSTAASSNFALPMSRPRHRIRQRA